MDDSYNQEKEELIPPLTVSLNAEELADFSDSDPEDNDNRKRIL